MAKRITEDERLYRIALDRAAGVLGPRALTAMGDPIRRALILSEALYIIAGQANEEDRWVRFAQHAVGRTHNPGGDFEEES